MLYLKSCRKCKGDILLESDNDGRYIHCLQCGWSKDLDLPPLEERVKTAKMGNGSIEALLRRTYQEKEEKGRLPASRA